MNDRKGSIPRHPDAIAWDAWLDTAEGRVCTRSPASGGYLQRRPRLAFYAGAKAARADAARAVAELFEGGRGGVRR